MAQSKYATRTMNMKNNFPNKSMFVYGCLDPQDNHCQKLEFMIASAAKRSFQLSDRSNNPLL